MEGVRATILSNVAHEDQGLETPCWIWQGRPEANGYAKRCFWPTIRRNAWVHRAAYEAFIGPIPAGLHIDHLCRQRLCCNPRHLEPVTQAENNRRCTRLLIRDVCKRGHPRTGANLMMPSRNCRECYNALKRQRRAAKKAA